MGIAQSFLGDANAKILYIGTKPFTDRLYNTGLSFDVKQSRDLPAETARLFLRHADLFELVESDSPKDTIKKDDDTQNQLNAQAQKMNKKPKTMMPYKTCMCKYQQWTKMP